jgi:hypothetical protein
VLCWGHGWGWGRVVVVVLLLRCWPGILRSCAVTLGGQRADGASKVVVTARISMRVFQWPRGRDGALVVARVRDAMVGWGMRLVRRREGRGL